MRKENLFKKATGLESKTFKRVFCSSEDQEDLKRNLKKAPEPHLNLNGDSAAEARESAYQTGITNSHRRLKKCLDNLKTVDEAGCSFKLIDFNTAAWLKTASDWNPVLIQNKEEPSKCRLIYKYERVSVTVQEDNDTVRNTVNVNKDRFVYGTGIGNDNIHSTIERTAEWVGERYNIQAYSCNHESMFHFRPPEERDADPPTEIEL